MSANAWAVVDHYVHDSGELQDALDKARYNHQSDNIFIYEGTYYGKFEYLGRDEDYTTLLVGGYNDYGKPSTDPTLTILDGENHGRVLLASFRGSLAIKNLTIQNGVDDADEGGGGAYLHTHQAGMVPDTLTLENTIIRNNHSTKMGGGIWIVGDAFEINLSNNLISGNSCAGNSGLGGGGVLITGGFKPKTIDHQYGKLVLNGNTFIENRSTRDDGGGLYIRLRSSSDGPVGSIIEVVGNDIIDNRVEDGWHQGGGFYIESISHGGTDESAPIVLRDNIIQGNRAPIMGGGGFIKSKSEAGTGASITVENNTITQNNANTGGGLEIRTFAGKEGGHAGVITLSGNTVSGNRADAFAGGISVWTDSFSESFSGTAGKIVVTNNVVTDNSSGDDVGGVYLLSGLEAFTPGNVVVTNNTIANNDAPDRCGGLFLHGKGNSFEVYNNIVWGNSADSGEDIFLFCSATFNGFNNNYSNITYSWTTEGANIDQDPLFVSGDDYHINYFSPCRNAGTIWAPDLPQFDIDGQDRIIGSSPEMGADEVGLNSHIIRDHLSKFIVP